jgi:ABC-2 type transport system permease protein
MIAAILRAQLLSMRLGARRGALLDILTGVLWYGLWTGAAVAACVLALQADLSWLHSHLPLVLLGICGYWQIIPVLSASMGTGLDMRKLLLYPVAHRQLFLVEVLLRLVSAAEMVLVVTGGSIGLLLNPAAGGWRAAHLAAAMPIFVGFNLLLASGVRSLLERLLARRRVRELLTFFLLAIYLAPRVLVQSGTGRHTLGGGLSALARVLGFPWSAAARVAVPAASGGFEWLALLSLGGWALAALWFAFTQFERNLRYDALAAQATPLPPGVSRWQERTERLYRVPSLFWRDPLAAIIEKELRSLARTPRFRMIFIMGFTFGLVVWFPMLAGRRSGQVATGSHYFLVVVCLYALTLLGQVTYWNCFGFDRSAAAVYFTAPQPLRKTLAGKNIASLFFVYLEVLVLAGITAALQLSGGLRTVIETLVVVGVCSLYLLALGNLSSVHYPRALRPERVSQGGKSSRFQGLIFLLYPLALTPVLLAYLARYAFDSEAVFAAGLAMAAVLGAVLYGMALESAAGDADLRREQILQELSRGEGPLASE